MRDFDLCWGGLKNFSPEKASGASPLCHNCRHEHGTAHPPQTGAAARPGMTARQWLRLVLIDSAVNIAFPDITGSFGLPIEMIQWVVICYVLTHASLMLAFGRLGDVFGYG